MNTRHITGEELQEALMMDEVIHVRTVSRGRWNERREGILEMDGRHYLVRWEDPLTEMQEGYYEDQDAPEVFLRERLRVVREMVYDAEESSYQEELDGLATVAGDEALEKLQDLLGDADVERLKSLLARQEDLDAFVPRLKPLRQAAALFLQELDTLQGELQERLD